MTLSWLSWEVAAQIATVVGLMLTAGGYVLELRRRTSLERKQRMKAWSDIAKLRALMTDLEKPLDDGGYDYGKHQAVGKLTSMFRDKIAHIFELTPKVKEEDISKWRASGKICSDWQESCFWESFPQEKLNSESIRAGLDIKDELPTSHPMAAKPDKIDS